MVAHHEPVARRADLDQAQVKRRLIEQIEPGFALAFQQRLQLWFLLGFGDGAPVQILDRRTPRRVNHLQHVFANVPAERSAQCFMTSDHRLPGLGETLGVELAVDAISILHVVQPGARLEQGVQQHAFLHWRQRVDIFDVRGRHRQGIELRLSQFRQREVRWRQAAGFVLQTMGDQALQLTEVGGGQIVNGLRPVTLGTESPAQQQFSTVNLTVDTQLVGQRRLRIVGSTDWLIERTEQRIAAEALVELAEVIESDRRLWQRRHALPAAVIGQIPQHAITETFVRHGAQLFFDRLDRSALPGGLFDIVRGQAQRISAGEPTDGAGQINLVEQGFATVSFQLNQCRGLAAPAAQHTGQRGQQQVVDLSAISARCLLQQLSGTFGIEVYADGLRMAILPAALRVFARQISARPGQLRLPPTQFLTQRFAAGVSLQTRGPVLEGAGFRRQFQRLRSVELPIGGLQIIQQHAPGNAVDDQVVDGDEQALLNIRNIDQHRAQ